MSANGPTGTNREAVPSPNSFSEYGSTPYIPWSAPHPAAPTEPIPPSAPLYLPPPQQSWASGPSSALAPPTAMPATPQHRPTPVLNTLIVVLAVLVVLSIAGVTVGALSYNTHKNVASIVGTSSTSNSASDSPYASGGKLVFNDPMTDNSQGHAWYEYSSQNTGGSCSFTNGSYVAQEATPNHSVACSAHNTVFNDFAYEAQIAFTSSGLTSGGLLFRRNVAKGTDYYFFIRSNGYYDLVLNTGTTNKILTYGKFPFNAFNLTGPNLIAVLARGPQINLYVNKQQISSVYDSTYTYGAIGVAAGVPTTEPATPHTVAYQNVKVWTF